MDARIFLPECLNNAGDPVDGATGVGSDLQRSFPRAGKERNLLVERLAGGKEIPDGWKERHSLPGEGYPLVSFVEQGEPDLFFEGFHHLCDSCLCISQFFTCFGITSGINDCKEYIPFSKSHGFFFPSE